MSINLAWKDIGPVDRIFIYRSESKMDLEHLPSPLVTLPGTARTFLDVEAKDRRTYYYVIKAERDENSEVVETTISYNVKMWHLDSRVGHGPTQLIRGDAKVGHFGILESSEFFTNQQLCTAFNAKHAANGHGAISLEPSAYSYGGLYVSTSGYAKGASWEIIPQIWHKFIHNGKILFIPVNPVGGRAMAINTRATADDRWSSDMVFRGYYFNQVTHLDIIRAGAYGDEEDPLVIEREGVRYRVRLMRGLNYGVETFDLTELNLKENGLLADHYNAIKDSELFSLYLPLFKNNAVIAGVKRLDNHEFPVSVTNIVSGHSGGDPSAVRNYRNYRPDILQLQGKDNAGNYGLMFWGASFYRHSQAAQAASRPSVTSANNATVSMILNPLHNPSNNPYGFMWHPVLELIDD